MTIKQLASIGLVAILALGAYAPCLVIRAQALANDSRHADISIKRDGELFAQFIYGDTHEFGILPRPVVYPIIGPTGSAMTRNFPMREGVEHETTDHPHHTSLWFTHGDVNGTDFWTQGEDKGVIRATRVERRDWVSNDNTQTSDAQFDVIESHEQWVTPDGGTLLDQASKLTFRQVRGTRYIDCVFEMTPAEDIDQVTFGDTKEGTMAIRLHPALRLKGEIATGRCVNSEDDTDGDCWGKRAKWVAYWGEIDGQTCGVAVFDHPNNLRHPTWWHARDYGLVAANPFGVHDFENKPEGTGDYTLEAGKTLTLRYRFVFFAGNAEQADIAGKYGQWAEETTPDEAQDDEGHDE